MGPASNLPSFSGLVEHVYQVNHLTPDTVEKEALDFDEPDRDRRRPNFDRALGLLERPDRLGGQMLRRTVIERLSKPPEGQLVTHEALINLSRTTKGHRLITTNFDNRFVEAGFNEKLIDTSPKLPVPKSHSWSSLVHLHGRILPEDDGSNLVLTGADFGRAYLTERWAARFITELFREFTVVFVGYSLGDPVLGYMVDALAAERAKGARFSTAYAFAEHNGGGLSKKRVEDGWLGKNVEPIPYDKQAEHKLLSDTLVEWARIKTDPYQARAQIALNEISNLPAGSNDPIVERVTWALQDPVAAKALADAPPIADEVDYPKLEAWLEMFEQAGLLSRPVNDKERNTTDQDKSPVRLVDSGARTHNPPPPDKATFQLGRWIARHLHVPEVLTWVLRKGGHLHPFLRDEVRRNLADPLVEIPPRLRHLWTVLAESYPIKEPDFLWTSQQLEKAASESERRRLEEHVLKSITPRLVVRPGPSSQQRFRQYFDKKPRGIPPIEACGHLELSVGDKDQRYQIKSILNDTSVLGRHAEALTSYLGNALTLLTDDDNTYSGSTRYRPSIAAHDQNRHQDDWTHLIDLVRDSYFALASSDTARAGNLLERWVLSRQPVFKRLALHVLTDTPRSDISLAKRLLVKGRKPGLWEPELRREVLRFLRLAGSRLPRSLRTAIVQAIHAGPKTKPRRPPKNYAEIVRREKALRLYKLDQAGATLDKKSKALAEKAKPPTGDVIEERDEFISWSGEARWIGREEFAPQNLLTGSIADVVAALSDGQIDPEEFEGLTLQQPIKAACAVRRLAKRREWPTEIWQRLLWSIAGLRRQQKLNSRLEDYVAGLLSGAPDELLSGVGAAAADFVEDLAGTYSVEQEDSFRKLWEKAWKGVRQEKQIDMKDPVTEALNHAAGKLAESALARMWKYAPKANDGLPLAVRSYFDMIASDPNGHLGRVMLASRLHQLYTIDPDWTGKRLISLFSPPESDEAQDLWSGYAWSPTIGPNLLAAIKDPFLSMLRSFRRRERRERSLVGLFVAICLEAPHELSAEEIHAVVDSLPEEGLTTMLHDLEHRLKSGTDERSHFWNDKIRPWLEKYWPTAAARNTVATSEAMLGILVECDSAFPEAVKWARRHLKPIEGRTLFRLKRSGHVARHPEAVLQLLEHIVDAEVLPAHQRHILHEILDELKEAAPRFAAEPDFQDLYRIATR